MKISYNWLKQYLDFNLTPKDVGEILTNTGLEVEDITTYESVKGGLEGVVIGEIVACEPHPDADKLQVTKVDVGTGELLQIVCGAPNARVGLKSPVALVGATLYPHGGEELKIKKAKIRGVESFGMICADDELGLGNSHAGVMELPADTKVGTKAADYFKIEKDFILEIGLTPNRSDAFSHIGVARDLRAALSAAYKIDLDFKKPEVRSQKIENRSEKIEVTVLDAVACPRYSGVLISGLKVAESPAWLKNRLQSIGLRSINNVVDVTNFVLHEYGQPLHAFDAAKINGNKIIVSKNSAGKFLALDGTERSIHKDDLMINDANGGMCIAGVFGGAASGVSETTTSIFLECAHFDAISIRKTSARHNLRTDAAMHFEKGCDINATVEVLNRAASLITEIGGGEIASEIIDIYPNPVKGFEVEVNYSRINSLIGFDLPKEVVKNILDKLEIKIESEQDDVLKLLVPTFKTEVKREADIVEEIIRIYGYNSIPMPKQLRSSLSFSPKVDNHKLENTIANMLTGAGFSEITTNSVTQSKFEQEEQLKKQQVLLLNSQTSELDCMRTSMFYSGLEVIAYNQNRKQTDLKLYEFGKTYHKTADGYSQQQHLVIYFTGKTAEDNWLTKGKKYDFYHLKSSVENILARMGVHATSQEVTENPPFVFASTLKHEEELLATFGQVSKKVLSNFDVKSDVFFADINWDVLTARSQFHQIQFSALPKFPAVRRDLAMLVGTDLPFDSIQKLSFLENKKILKDVSLFDVYEGDKIEAGKKSYAVSFTFQDKDKTLTDQDVDKVMTRLMTKLESELKVQIRK